MEKTKIIKQKSYKQSLTYYLKRCAKFAQEKMKSSEKRVKLVPSHLKSVPSSSIKKRVALKVRQGHSEAKFLAQQHLQAYIESGERESLMRRLHESRLKADKDERFKKILKSVQCWELLQESARSCFLLFSRKIV